jgi:hypothetical protein
MTLDIPVAGTALDPGLFSGKRRAPRTRRTLLVECAGPGGVIATGRTVDVSKGGMLLEMTEGEFQAPTDPSLLVAFASRLATSFPDGMAASFGEGAVRARATIVRLVTSPTGTTPILLGCRFDPPLEPVDCALLGLDTDGDETTEKAAQREADALASGASPAHPLHTRHDDLLTFIQATRDTWVDDRSEPGSWSGAAVGTTVATARKSATKLAPATEPKSPAVGESLTDEDMRGLNRRTSPPAPAVGSVSSPDFVEAGEIVAHLFPAVFPFLGPRYRGRVVELRTRALIVDLPVPAGEADPVGWAAGIGLDARIVCLRDGRVLWETRARVQRFEPGAGPGAVRAVLLADRAPTHAARRQFGVVASAVA